MPHPGSPIASPARLILASLDLTGFALPPFDDTTDLDDTREVERYLADRWTGGDS